MAISGQESYKKLKVQLDKHRQSRSNLVIVTLPGLGLGRLLSSYQTDVGKEVVYLEEEGGKLGKYSLINMSWVDWRKTCVGLGSYCREAVPDGKMAVAVDYPEVLGFDEVKKIRFFSEVYGVYYFGARGREETDSLVKEIGGKTKEEVKDKIYRWSGGIPRLIKYLSLNSNSLEQEIDEVVKSSELENLIRPIIEASFKLKVAQLEELGMVNKSGGWCSEIIAVKLPLLKKLTDLVVDFDLSLLEFGEKTGEKLVEVEKRIVEEMIGNENKITKEKIAEIKWGEGSYDKFSDQAINMAMKRLAKKLRRHRIVTVPRVGYLLETK